MTKRKSISTKVRFEVFKRDGFKCVYCGAPAPSVILVIDHVEPVAGGGADDILNLVTSCEPCNEGKSDRRLSDDSVVAKRRKQAEASAEAREQALAVLEWQRELAASREEIARKVFAPLLVDGWGFSESGLRKAVSLIKEVGHEDVLEAVSSSAELLQRDRDGKVTQTSWERAFSEVIKRAKWASACRQQPNLREAARIRAMLRRSCPWGHQIYWSQLLTRLKRLLDDGVPSQVLWDELRGLTSTGKIDFAIDDISREWLG